MNTHKPTLVLGGTGKTGRRVVGAPHGARPAGADRLALRRAAVRLGGPLDVGARARGRRRPCTSPTTRTSRSRARSRKCAPSRELALENGVRRQVLLSGRGEEEAQRAEQAVQETGADWTIVRCAWFMQNFSEDFMLESILGGELALPAGDQLEPFVDADDIADVAVAALTDDRHIGQLV